MPVLDLFFSMLWFFLFILWIWLVISNFIDIFRSDDLSGWGKAGWTIFVIIVPLLGVLVYLIARGDKMQQRSINQARAHQAGARMRDLVIAQPGILDGLLHGNVVERGGVTHEPLYFAVDQLGGIELDVTMDVGAKTEFDIFLVKRDA